jgi:hypothetical protein
MNMKSEIMRNNGNIYEIIRNNICRYEKYKIRNNINYVNILIRNNKE